MLDLDANADSVNFLITELCRSIARQHDVEQYTPVAKLKAQCFEILLKMSKERILHDSNNNGPNDRGDFEPQRALQVQIFAAKLNANSNPEECAKFKAFDKQLLAIEQDTYFTSGAGKELLQLLLQLQRNVGDADDARRAPSLLVPGPFTLHANYRHNQHYPRDIGESIHCPAPKHFQGLQTMRCSSNPYLPKFLFEGECNLLTQLDQKYANAVTPTQTAAQHCSFTGLTQQLWGNSMRIQPQAFRLFANCSSGSQPSTKKSQQKSATSFSCNKTSADASASMEVSTCSEMRRFSWNWEQLGNFGIVCAKPFASESHVVLHLQSVHQKALGQQFVAKIVSQEQFLQDLKSLTVGIQSDSFVHDDLIVFSMQPNLTVDGVLPATIKNFVADFLECGTCYKRLQTMIMKRDYKLMFEGFMFKALCSAIDEYLITFRQYVFAQQDVYLMQFYKRMKKMMNQIANLSFTLAIHANVDASVKPPMGSQFLGYLYREIIRLTEKDYITLLVFILKRCCHVYFKHLQKWIFYGVLDDPSNELFVGFVDHYRQNTKYFYDKAYFVCKEAVPGFFQNFEDQILQCGKYTMLLKAYKPNHPVFDLEYPAISVCLTFDEIQRLEANCSKYFERARELCGKPISMRQVFESRAERKRNFYQMVSQRSRENMEKWSDEQHALALLAAEHKKQRLRELTTQLEDAKTRKVAERRGNVELELKLLKDAAHLEEQRLMRENINLRKRIEYYQEVSDMMQSDVDAAEAAVTAKQRLQLPDAEATSITSQKHYKQPHTPASTAGTDFESCYGEEEEEQDADDDEGSSEYAECISDDFEQKFEQSESELQSYCAQQTHTVEQPVVEADTASADFITLKRSASDFLNSNELPAPTLSTLQKNRQQALSGSNMQQCVKQPSTSGAVLQVQTAGDLNVPLTEAQRNKLKVLSLEFDYAPADAHTRSLPDVNLNTLPDSDLTALQRNRRRMMQNDTFAEFNRDPSQQREHLKLDLDSERAQNKRKVLESEYHILTGKPTPSSTTITLEPLTPMSTTSDTPLSGSSRQQDFETKTSAEATEQKGDLANGNVQSELKINVALAKDASHTTLDTAATLPAPTPECALNTAGLLAKQGFDFSNQEQQLEQRQKQQQAAALSGPNQHDLTEPNCLQLDYSTPYKRCVELIESNFQCATRSPYFRLNIINRTSPVVSKSHEALLRSMQHQLDLNSTSVITLTEFLQKSVIIPMNTHLEIMNNEVMRMFLEDLRLLDHFKSLRNYFFLMDGEFGAFICDGIIGKLEMGATPEKLLNYQMLHSVLENALGSSIIGNDKNAANLSFIVSDLPEQFDLHSPAVLGNLSLSYRVSWPLNLILNPETLEQYANIFKYLIKVRRISWVLEGAYQILKEAVKCHGKVMLQSPQYRHVQQIRHKFYHFVHALQNHITANALQASWKTFKDDLLHAQSIEDIYRKHTTYVKRIIFLCMLNRRSVEFYNTIENIFKISLRFYNNLKCRQFKIRAGDEHYTHSRYDKLATDELEFDKFIKYTIYLGNKIVRHGYQEEIGEFISLINYNQYYIENAN